MDALVLVKKAQSKNVFIRLFSFFKILMGFEATQHGYHSPFVYQLCYNSAFIAAPNFHGKTGPITYCLKQ